MTEWCTGIDDGPFHALAVGERIAYPNLEAMTALSFAAAATERVCLSPTIVVLPAHPALVAAKQLASLDVLSGGRVVVGVGVGGREEDYLAFEAPFAGLHSRLDQQMAEMRMAWAGEVPDGLSQPIGPAPVGAMPVLSGSLGPKSMRRAAKWASGVNGFSLSPNTDDWHGTFSSVRAAWSEADSSEEPYLATSFFYSAGDDETAGASELADYAYRYLKVFGTEPARAMASLTTATSLDHTMRALDAIEAAGADEVYLVPVTTAASALTATSAALRQR